MPNRISDDREWYEGTSAYMRWAPKVCLAMAGFIFIVQLSHWIQFASVFVLVAFIHSRWLPWRFEIRDDGIELLFPFGRRRFLNRGMATVRVHVVGAVAYDDRRGRFTLGYPLMDGILFQPGQESLLFSAFHDRGYNVTAE